MKKVLITGADGFIGSHLAEMMVRSGYQVKTLVQYNSFSSFGWLDSVEPQLKSEMEIVVGDIREASFVNSIVKGCDQIMHLAALIAIPYSYHNPSAYVQTNVLGTCNILEAANNHNISKVVHTSTSEIYGTAQFVPITEQHPVNAQSPYAATKIAADQLALSFHRSFGTRVAIVRPFNTYGPRQSVRAVIPTIIRQLDQGKSSIALGALTPTRDFSYVEDTASGMISVLESEKSIGEIINLGSGFEISIKDTVQVISQVMEKEVTVTTSEERLRPQNSEVERLYAGIEKAGQLLNWKPTYAGLEGFKQGIAKTVQWFTSIESKVHYRDKNFIL